MTDPWKCKNQEIINENTNENQLVELEFEDNFSNIQHITHSNSSIITALPDSKTYLESLEKKLQKLKKTPNIVQQLTEKREECLRNLLNESINLDRNNDTIALDASIITSDSTVQDIYRHICPVQPLTLGETVHIVKHDQLAKSEEDSASETESASR